MAGRLSMLPCLNHEIAFLSPTLLSGLISYLVPPLFPAFPASPATGLVSGTEAEHRSQFPFIATNECREVRIFGLACQESGRGRQLPPRSLKPVHLMPESIPIKQIFIKEDFRFHTRIVHSDITLPDAVGRNVHSIALMAFKRCIKNNRWAEFLDWMVCRAPVRPKCDATRCDECTHNFRSGS